MLTHKLFFTVILLALSINLTFAQGSGLNLGNPAYHTFDRLEIINNYSFGIQSTLKPFLRGDLTKFAIHIDTISTVLSKLDRQDLQYIFNDNNEWLHQPRFQTTLTGPNETLSSEPKTERLNTASINSKYYQTTTKPAFKYFYKTPANFFEINQEFFYMKLNPIINFKLAKASNDNELIFQNTRGIEVRGAIDDRVYFYTNILETQHRFADYVNERIENDEAVPGANFFKTYQSEIFNITNGYDYLNAQGYIGFNLTKHIGLQFGHGQNFIGNGYRSLLLSDYGSNYFYLKFNTKVWRLHYQNIFAELAAVPDPLVRGDELLPRKYMAAHYLDFRLFKNMTIGLYEAIIFSRNNQFEFQYLNPVILYRTVEQYIGSPDNALIGLNFKWNLLNKFQIYSQLMLDEFKFDELFLERRGWWANKYGFQLGLKYINTLGIDHLDTQIEYNQVRPYTYTHRDSSASYSHYHQPLAHPLGANVNEIIFKARYQPIHKLVFDARFLLINYGEEGADTNWGTNILLPHTTREMDFGNEIGQGIGTNVAIFGLDVSYQILHNIYIDLHYFYRKQNSDLAERNRTTNYIGGGFRMNIANRNYDF